MSSETSWLTSKSRSSKRSRPRFQHTRDGAGASVGRLLMGHCILKDALLRLYLGGRQTQIS